MTAGQVSMKGKLGSLAIAVREGLSVKVGDGKVVVEAAAGVPRAQVGTLRALIRNAIAGVSEGYERFLQVRGMGYRVQKTKEGVQIQCGFSHTVEFVTPTGVAIEVGTMPNPDDTKQQMYEIVVRGIDAQAVGQFAASIRATKLADPYKGKGVRYRDEYIKKKAGKRAVGAQA